MPKKPITNVPTHQEIQSAGIDKFSYSLVHMRKSGVWVRHQIKCQTCDMGYKSINVFKKHICDKYAYKKENKNASS